MEFVVCSKMRAETWNPVEKRHVIISITHTEDPQVTRPATNAHTLEVLRLVFDDLDKQPGPATTRAIGQMVIFDHHMADKIIDLMLKHAPEVVIVHCGMGQSRSPAVAAALSRWFNGDDSAFFPSAGMYGRPAYTPNMLVYRVLLNRLEQRLAV